jgi:hypothetical protein
MFSWIEIDGRAHLEITVVDHAITVLVNSDAESRTICDAKPTGLEGIDHLGVGIAPNVRHRGRNG